MILQVEGMSCAHCVAAVKRTLAALPGIESVEVDLKEGRVHLTGGAPVETIRTALDEQGYDLVDVKEQ